MSDLVKRGHDQVAELKSSCGAVDVRDVAQLITKEWLQQTIAELEEERDATPGAVNEDAAMALAAIKLALASLEAEAVGEVVLGEFDDAGCHPDARVACIAANGQADWENFKDGTRLYTATPAPVSVPDAIHSQGEKSASDDYYALGWNACRAAMLKHSEPFIVTSDHRMMEMPQVEAINAVTAILQGADGTLTNEGTIPVTQFKPVADLYGLTSPTGGETSFTFDAVEARDFIDGGWSCQEYVELGRFQEAMLQGAENAESPTTMKTAPALDSSPKIAESPSGNYPVIQDGWVACSERMPEESGRYWCYVEEQNDLGKSHYQWNCSWNGDRWWVESENGGRVTHWMPLPAAPQQEDRIQCCRTHPQTALQVHPFEMLMSLPPKQKMYCPECEPGVAERIDMMKNISSPKVGE
ncbi:DUF551 domain-containing protein [Enterobacter hormaechei]